MNVFGLKLLYLMVSEWLMISCIGMIGFIFVGLLLLFVIVLCRLVRLMSVVCLRMLWYIMCVGNYGKLCLCLCLMICFSELVRIVGL